MEKSLAHRFKELKLCVLIPTYNNATTLSAVLKSVLHYTDQVLVVNEGNARIFW